MLEKARGFTKLELTNEWGTYTISLDRTEMSIDEILEHLVIPGLLAAGYLEESIMDSMEGSTVEFRMSKDQTTRGE